MKLECVSSVENAADAHIKQGRKLNILCLLIKTWKIKIIINRSVFDCHKSYARINVAMQYYTCFETCIEFLQFLCKN